MGRILVCGLLAVFVLPMLLSALMPLISGLMVMSVVARSSTSEKPVRNAAWNVVNLTPGNPREASFATLVKRDELLDQRSVNISTYMDLSDMRGNEPRPSNGADYEEFAKLRAPIIARDECNALKQSVADKCVVREADVTPYKNGLYRVTMELLFTPKQSLGDVPTPSELEYMESNVNLSSGAGGRSSLMARDQLPRERIEIYRAASIACDKLRAANGNCAILNMRLKAYPDKNSFGIFRQEGSATLVRLQKVNTVSR